MVFLPTFLKKERTPPVSKPCLLGKLEKRIRPSGVFRYKPRDSRSENPETLNKLNTTSGTVGGCKTGGEEIESQNRILTN